jgi:hypothetical protein
MEKKAIVYFVATFSAVTRSFVQVARDKAQPQPGLLGFVICSASFGLILLIIAWVTDFSFGVGP